MRRRTRLVKPAQLWQGNCLELMANIPDRSVDFICCDLPYGTTACAWDVIIPFNALWAHYKRVAKPRAEIALFGTEPFSTTLRVSNLGWFRYDWVWDKVLPSGFQIAKFRPMQQCEIVSVFSDKSPRWFPIKTAQKLRNCGGFTEVSGSSPLNKADGVLREHDTRNPTSLLSFYKRDAGGGVHATQKPVALIEYLIKTYSLEGETVLDNTMGGGTAGIACARTARNFIGIEKDPGIFQTACTRIRTAERTGLVVGRENKPTGFWKV